MYCIEVVFNYLENLKLTKMSIGYKTLSHFSVTFLEIFFSKINTHIYTTDSRKNIYVVR